MSDLEQAEDEQAAKSRAPQEIQDKLVEMLELFCKSQDLPYLSADELLFEELTDDQRQWVQAFCDLWEANERYTK